MTEIPMQANVIDLQPFGLPTKQIMFRLTGVSGILMSNPSQFNMAAPAPGKLTARGTRGSIPTPEEEAQAGLYWDEGMGLYMPAASFRNAMLTAAKSLRFKSGGRGRAISLRSVLSGTVFAVGDKVPLVSPETDQPLGNEGWEISIMRAVPPGQGAVRRARPHVRKWRALLALEYLTEYLGLEGEGAIFEALKRAGLTIGVGNYRPEKGGPFGRWMTERQVSSNDWSDQ